MEQVADDFAAEIPWLSLLLFALVGGFLWRSFVEPLLPKQRESYDGRGLFGLFLMTWLISSLVSASVIGEVEDPAAVSFTQTIQALTLGGGVAILLMVVITRVRPEQRVGLGLSGTTARAPVLTAFAAYLMMIPALAVLGWLSDTVIAPLFDLQSESGVQELVQRLLEAEGEPTLSTWLAVCLVIPFAEELLFRGALFGGLRARFGFWPAGLLSAALFAALHPGALFFLPLAGLGLLLAYLRERTGSITASVLLHGFNNAQAIGLAVAVKATSG